jgi:hypothetical protein
MAIHPIDLQTMYSQINNVAKLVSHQTDGTQLASAMQQNTMIQQNLEHVTTVQKAANSDAKSTEVNADGKNSADSRRKNKRKNGEEQDESAAKKTLEIRESYLGQHIDITR